MTKRFEIEMKYYASCLGIHMCNYRAPKNYLWNGTLEGVGFKLLRHNLFFTRCTQAII